MCSYKGAAIFVLPVLFSNPRINQRLHNAYIMLFFIFFLLNVLLRLFKLLSCHWFENKFKQKPSDKQPFTGRRFQIFFIVIIFYPYLWRWSNLNNSFQMGRNHIQLGCWGEIPWCQGVQPAWTSAWDLWYGPDGGLRQMRPWQIPYLGPQVHGCSKGVPLQGGTPPQNHNLQNQRKSY